MRSFPLPTDEAERLAHLRASGLLETVFDQSFEDLVQLACEVCEAPIGLITLLEEHRQLFKIHRGLALTQTARADAFCAHTLVEREDSLVVGDARTDPRFCANVLVTGELQIRFYAGVNLRGTGRHVLGSLCVLDRVPRTLTEAQLAALRTLGRAVERQLELHRLTSELKAANAALAHERAQLRRVEQEKAELTLLVVHDLKNPLATLLANGRFLNAQPELSQDSREAVRDVLDTATTLHERVLLLLDASQTELQHPAASSVGVQELLAELCRSSARRAREGQRRVVLGEVPPQLRASADPRLLRRVLENLVSNALQYSPEQTEVTLDAAPLPDGRVVLRVLDRGGGVPEEARQRIFELHVQLEGGERPARGNVGAGLAFCKRAMEAQRGAIWVEPRPGGGSSFCVALPPA